MSSGNSLKDIFRSLRGHIKAPFEINSKETLGKAAASFGILPFFPNKIRGFSVEEMCGPGMLFGGNYDEGCWEWKGPVIREREAIYGKFFRRKAGFVSKDLIPDFINYRHKTYPVEEGSTEEMLLDIIRVNDSITSTELKKWVFGNKKEREWDEVPDLDKSEIRKPKSKSLEAPLQRLQMGGWIVISDFEYKTTKRGERYGWGVARYSTPEYILGDKIINDEDRTPRQSLEFIVKEIKRRFKNISEKDLRSLLE